ncbi:MAG: hypothetical protein JXR41_10525, partial [Bacteroidales bacterium]|nr:hypothetical protein [Bacteroidales bacterium]
DSSFHHPGNLYYFIRIIDNECTTEYTWGENGYKVPEMIGVFYKETINRLSDLPYKPVKKPVK